MRRQSAAGTIAAMGLTCVFGATLLLSLVTGASAYRNVAARTEQGANTRVGLTYLTTKIHGADHADAVYVGTFGGTDAIYLLQDMDGLTYETILYVYDGQLRELLCEQGWELEPEDGESISEARSLTVSEPEAGLLRLTFVDGGGMVETADIFLRSR